MLTVACVLRSGPEYKASHVAALRDDVTKHLTVPHRFVCLSDCDVPCERIPLAHRWPGYWSKIELFRPGLFDGMALYIDLDSAIVKQLNDLTAYPHRFTMLRDFYWPEFPASGVMAWSVDLSAIYHAFAANPKPYMLAKPTRGAWGDQGVIAKCAPVAPEFWQDIFPRKIVSYKAHVRKPQHPRESGDGCVPADAALVAYHGRPRPWQAPLKELARQ